MEKCSKCEECGERAEYVIEDRKIQDIYHINLIGICHKIKTFMVESDKVEFYCLKHYKEKYEVKK